MCRRAKSRRFLCHLEQSRDMPPHLAARGSQLSHRQGAVLHCHHLQSATMQLDGAAERISQLLLMAVVVCGAPVTT